jgi:predicted porin
MKKSLFAIAAVTAFAGAAQAQSSVTVYGILDVGYGMANTRSAQPNTINAASGVNTANTVGQQVINSNFGQFGQSYQSTSRLGFRGTEDLGGGRSAFFTIETALTPNGQTGIFGGTAANTNRQTFIGIGQKGIGRASIGTQYTPMFTALGATDPGQVNNMMGNLMNDKAGPVALTGNTGAATVAAQNYAGNQDNTAFTVRNNNMLLLTSDRFAGFTASAFYSQNGNTTGSTSLGAGNSGYGGISGGVAPSATAAGGGVTDNTGWGAGLNYTWKKLLLTANYQSFTSKQAYSMVNSTGVVTNGVPTIGFSGASPAFGVNSKDNQQYYAATYDFGILQAYAQYVARKVSPSFSGAIVPTSLNRAAQQVGVRSNLTPKIQTWASIGSGTVTYFDTNEAKMMGYQLGANYLLSKRTNLYAIYGAQSTSNAAITIGTTPVNTASYNASSAAIGVRHSF